MLFLFHALVFGVVFMLVYFVAAFVFVCIVLGCIFLCLLLLLLLLLCLVHNTTLILCSMVMRVVDRALVSRPSLFLSGLRSEYGGGRGRRFGGRRPRGDNRGDNNRAADRKRESY